MRELLIMQLFNRRQRTAEKLIMEGEEAEQSGQNGIAIEKYSKAINLSPSNIRAYHSRAKAYVKIRKRRRAIEDYSKIIALEPGSIYAYHERGRAYRDKKMYENAIEDYTKEIELSPKNARAYNSRGYCLSAKKEYKKAIEDFSKAIELDPGYAIAYYNRGISYRTMRLYDKAIKDHEKYQILEPNGKYTKKLMEVAIMDKVREASGASCPSCGEEINISAHFCSGCGFNLGEYLKNG